MRVLGRTGENIATPLEDAIHQMQNCPKQFGTVTDWANESFLIATPEVYSAPIILPREYPASEENIVRTQLKRSDLSLA